MATKLTPELLKVFESRLDQLGVLAVREARPGLSEEEMTAIVESYGLSLPAEARIWWGWRDGVPASAGAAATELGPGRKWLPLSEALAQRESFRKLKQGDRTGSADSDQWAERLPLILAGGLYLIEPDASLTGACPVWVLWSDDEPGMPPAVESIGRLVELWLEAIDSGAWAFDRQANVWRVDHERLEALLGAKQGIV